MDNKDKSILTIVAHLKNRFGETEVLVKDHWDGDSCAIGLTDKTGQYLVYISTFGMPEHIYYVVLENPSDDMAMPYVPAGEYDNVSIEELEKIVAAHFKINR